MFLKPVHKFGEKIKREATAVCNDTVVNACFTLLNALMGVTSYKSFTTNFLVLSLAPVVVYVAMRKFIHYFF